MQGMFRVFAFFGTAVFLVYLVCYLVVLVMRLLVKKENEYPPDRLVSMPFSLAIIAPIVAFCSLLAGIYYLMFSAIAASLVFSVVYRRLPQDRKNGWYERSVAANMKVQPKISARGTVPVSKTGQVLCPKCSSSQVQALKSGFSGWKAVGGAVLAGPVGLLAGVHGAGKIKVACIACGHTWKAGT